MSSTTDPVLDMYASPANFWQIQEKIGFVDLRTKTTEGSHHLLHHLIFERPCHDLGAVPPSLLDEYNKADDPQKAIIAFRYAGNSYGVEAYIVQLRMQIAYGIKMENGLHARTRHVNANFEPTAANAIWDLAHHHFGRDRHSDLKVKGTILWLMHGQKDVEKIPNNTMDGLQELDANLAYPLMFERPETALIGPVALQGTGPSREDLTWKHIRLPHDKIPFLHEWNGNVGLEDTLNSVLTRNLARDFPELVEPAGASVILSVFNRPLLIPVRYKWDGEHEPTMEIGKIRSFRLCDHALPPSGPAGTEPVQSTYVHYDLCAVVNLDTDDVRLYGPRTIYIAERPPPDRDNAAKLRTPVPWSLGDKQANFILWYRRIDLEDGETYMPPIDDAQEFISAEEVDRLRQVVGEEPLLWIERPDDEEVSSTNMSS